MGGCIISTGSIDEIVTAIARIGNASTRIMMSEWNLKKVKTTYTIDNVIESIRDIYQEVISESN
jgi:glycosyltransferase involved in cell wall biosynthesis